MELHGTETFPSLRNCGKEKDEMNKTDLLILQTELAHSSQGGDEPGSTPASLSFDPSRCRCAAAITTGG
jgi:hypothetical protein